MKLLFTALVRPHLEFANVVWSPRQKKDQTLIEGVLRRATKCVPGLHDLDYEERLKVINIPSMAYRRIRGDLIEVYKYTHGWYDCKDIFELTVDSTTRGHNYKIKKKFCKSNARHHFFTQRVTDTWNALDYNVVNAETLNSFKNRLDAALKDFIYQADISHPLIPHQKSHKSE